MSNIEIQNNKTRGVVVWAPVFKDEIVTAAGAAVFAAGTILARDSVSLKLVLFVKGGSTNENGVPKAVLTQDLEFAGAGDLPVKAMVEGQVRTGDMIIDSDGDASNIDAAVLDQLRDYGIVGLSTTQLAELDNQ
jgi:hypothetical protein